MRQIAALTLTMYLGACSSGGTASNSPASAGSAAVAGGAGTSAGGASAGGAAGAGSSSGDASSSGGAGASGAGASGAATTGGAAAVAGAAGVSGAAGAAGAAGATGLSGTVKIMVLGSSNELITCWRALLWQKLQTAKISNFDLVGGVTSGPDCGVPGYDKDLQAKSGTIVSDLTAGDFAGWFQAHPPQIVLAHFGGADLLANMPVSGIIKGYTLALEQARLVTPQVRFMIAKHTPQNSGSSVPELSAATVTWAAQNTTPSSPVTVVDLYTGLDTASDTSDGVHLNVAGSEKVASRWFAALEPLFKP